MDEEPERLGLYVQGNGLYVPEAKVNYLWTKFIPLVEPKPNYN